MVEPLMKKIIHFKFDKNKSTYEEISTHGKNISDFLPDYSVILTPFDMNIEDENDIALNLNGINYTHAQLEEMLDKAAMYDDLCK